MQHTEFTWNYFTEPSEKACLGIKNEACYWPRGKILGGSGAINAMLYVKGNRKDYDDWKDLGNKGWGWDDVLPYFEKSRRNDSGAGVTLNKFENFDSMTDIVVEAAKELGNNILEDDFAENQDLGYCHIYGHHKNGKRSNTAKSYLASAKDRPNLHVIKNAIAKKINMSSDGKTVKSVTFVYKGEHEMTVEAKKELVLSAGAIDTPKLLLLSGFGPKQHLNKLGIPVVRDLRVGDNLQDHVFVPMFYKIQEKSSEPFNQKEYLDHIYNYLMHQKGPLSTIGMTGLVGFINSDESSDSPYPDIEMHHIPISRQSPTLDILMNAIGYKSSIVNSIRPAHENSNLFVSMACLMRPKSVGSIRLMSNNYQDSPKIFANYFDDPEDVETLLRGMKYQLKFDETNAFKANDGEFLALDLPECDKFEFKSDEYLRCYIKYMANTVYHPIGTAKMGPESDKTAVVDDRLRVVSVSGLRVVDASIMPKLVSANTNAPTIMIAEKAADFIKEEWGKVERSEL